MKQESKHTPKEVADFILDEVLNPFTESSLYEDYQEDWEANHDDKDLFNDRYDEAIRLIAAAPDMLEALEALFKNCSMIHNTWGDGCNQREADAAIAAGRAAIAKAKGG